MTRPSAPDLPSEPEREFWEKGAGHWIAHGDEVAAMTREATAALIARLDLRPGQRVLDVAAGVGTPAFDIAQQIGPDGEVVATDAVEAMVDELRRRAEARGFPWVYPVHVAAEDLDFEPGGFDGACCRFGVMFFSNPGRALARMARATRPGGRLVLAAWADRRANPYLTLVDRALNHIGVPDAPVEKNVFEFEDPEALATLGRDAGWQHVATETVSFTMTLKDTSPATLLEAREQRSRKTGRRLEIVDAATRERARALVTERAAPFARDGDLCFPAVATLMAGAAP